MSKKAIKGTIIPPKVDARFKAKAMAEHLKVMTCKQTAQESFLELAAHLAKMKQGNLWAGVSDKDHPEGFNDWTAYRQFVLGDMGKTRLYELIAIHELTQGDKPIAPSIIKRMGIKRAYEFSRVEPEKRSPQLITLAQSAPLAEVKEAVQSLINEDLPKDRQKEHTVAFVRMLPPSLIAKYEELEEDGIWLEGIRDHDPSMTSKQKFFAALLANFRATHLEELQEAKDFRLAHEAAPEAVHETELNVERDAVAVQ